MAKAESPGIPNCSYMAIWGFTAGTKSQTASTIPLLNCQIASSNPSSGEFQDRIIEGKPLYEHVGKMVDEWGKELMGDAYSYVGAVVGATYPEMGKVLRDIMPKAYILVPGYGAQVPFPYFHV